MFSALNFSAMFHVHYMYYKENRRFLSEDRGQQWVKFMSVNEPPPTQRELPEIPLETLR